MVLRTCPGVKCGQVTFRGFGNLGVALRIARLKLRSGCRTLLKPPLGRADPIEVQYFNRSERADHCQSNRALRRRGGTRRQTDQQTSCLVHHLARCQQKVPKYATRIWERRVLFDAIVRLSSIIRSGNAGAVLRDRDLQA